MDTDTIEKITTANAKDMVFFYKAAPNFMQGKATCKLNLLDSCREKIDPKLFMPYPLWNVAPTSPPIDYSNHLSGTFGGGVQSGGIAKGPKHSAAYNLIGKVVACAGVVWVVIPRVKDGHCWVAKIRCNQNYEIWPKTSAWLVALDTQLQQDIKHSAPCDRYIFLADAAQGWKTSEWRQVAFPRFPRWFSKQFLSQSSFGEIHPLNGFVGVDSPSTVAKDCWINATKTVVLPLAITCAEIQKRLVERLSPTALEFLCVELLNLKHQNRLFWLHIGGVGDGGNDGIGFDLSGVPQEFLSVKWEINQNTTVNTGAIIAYLVGTPPIVCGKAQWNSNAIAADVYTYRQNLSLSFKKLLGV